MSYKKVSLIVLGSEAALKRALITVIIGGDEAAKSSYLKESEIYENNNYKIIYTPDLNKPSKDIKSVFVYNKDHDRSLLVVKEGFSTGEVWKQIEELHKLTGKSTEEFIVVLPLIHEHTESYPFTCLKISNLFSTISKMAEDRRQKATSTSHADHPDDPMKVAGKPSDSRVNLVLLGMSGSGKSASGNTILGKTIFPSKASSSPVTAECQAEDKEIGSSWVRVIDTPDIFDDDINDFTKKQHVNKCKELSEHGSTVYLLVMHVSRFTDGERNILRKLGEAFGSKVHEQTLILFTRENDLMQGDMTQGAFIHSLTPDLKKIVTKCDNRCVWFENKAPSSGQVERLMHVVHQMLIFRNNSAGSWWRFSR